MIAADTSAWVDFTKGIASEAALRLEAALTEGNLVIPEPTLYEILSGPGLTKEAEASFLELPRLGLMPGCWERAAGMRRALLRSGRKARAMDCLIAQVCIDHKVGLIALDRDFRHFSRLGLRLV